MKPTTKTTKTSATPSGSASREAVELLIKSLCHITSEMATDAKTEVKNGIVYVHCVDHRDGMGSGYWDFTVPKFHPQ